MSFVYFWLVLSFLPGGPPVPLLRAPPFRGAAIAGLWRCSANATGLSSERVIQRAVRIHLQTIYKQFTNNLQTIYKQFTNNLQTIYKQFTNITHHKENKHIKHRWKKASPAISSIISTRAKISTQIQDILTGISSFIALHFVLSGNTTREMQNQLACTVFLLWHCLRKE